MEKEERQKTWEQIKVEMIRWSICLAILMVIINSLVSALLNQEKENEHNRYN